MGPADLEEALMFAIATEPDEVQQLLATIRDHLPADVDLGEPLAVFADALVTLDREMFSPQYAGEDDDTVIGVCRWKLLRSKGQELTVFQSGQQVHRAVQLR